MEEFLLCKHSIEDEYFAVPLQAVVKCLNQVNWHCTKRKGQFSVKDIDYVDDTLHIVLCTGDKAFMLPASECFAGKCEYDDDKLLANNTLQILDDITVDKVNRREP